MVGSLLEWGTEVTDFLAHVLEARGKGAKARLLRDPRRLAVERHRLRDICHPLGQGLFELTTTHDGMEYRCFYVFHQNEIVVLVCFEKKSRKAPQRYIEIARARQKQLALMEVTLGDVTLH